MNETYFVGNVDKESKFLVYHTFKAMEAAINIVKDGEKYENIPATIEDYITAHK